MVSLFFLVKFGCLVIFVFKLVIFPSKGWEDGGFLFCKIFHGYLDIVILESQKEKQDLLFVYSWDMIIRELCHSINTVLVPPSVHFMDLLEHLARDNLRAMAGVKTICYKSSTFCSQFSVISIWLSSRPYGTEIKVLWVSKLIRRLLQFCIITTSSYIIVRACIGFSKSIRLSSYFMGNYFLSLILQYRPRRAQVSSTIHLQAHM